ncbi:PQQ-binding-like beta-propeller repeat protein [Natronococcus sp.]|uniref:outer membrane protein assembly factor BamB family protein n=1 Tax=Natronococcus sp. TaxID=35747 RepID=UPI003A4E55B8
MSERTRREWLATVGAIGVVGCSSASNGTEPEDDEPTIDTTSPDGWPVAGHDVANTRHSAADGPKNDVEPRWTFDDVSLEFDDPALAVAEGTVYVGTEDGQVRELDSETGDGSTLVGLNDGEHRSDDVPIRAVTAAGDRLYFVSDGVYAVDATTGEVLWTFEETALESGSGIETPAVVVDGTVYAGGYGLYAIDAASGEERWRVDLDSEYERTVTVGRTSPIATDETVYAAEDDRNAVFAVSVADEAVRWSTEPTDGVGTHGGLALADGLVYAIRADGILVALEEG